MSGVGALESPFSKRCPQNDSVAGALRAAQRASDAPEEAEQCWVRGTQGLI